MNARNIIRQHWAALRALLAFTVITGLAYPLLIWLIALMPGLHDKSQGSIVYVNSKPVGSRIIGQPFTDQDGNALPQYFQSRPSEGGPSNLGSESIVDTPGKPSLLTQVCTRSITVGRREGVDGSRPFCTGDGVGAVLSVIGPRVVSVNQPCSSGRKPFLTTYGGVPVECARDGQDYSTGRIVPIRGGAPADPAVPADAVTASASGLDPDISVAYAQIQVARVAKARNAGMDQIRRLVADHEDDPALGFIGQASVNVLELNIALDQRFPLTSSTVGG